MKSLYYLFAFALVSAPTVIFAQGLSYTLNNPLNSNIGSIEGLLTTILNVLLVIAVPIIVFFIIFAGFKYVTAQGNPEKIKEATRMLTYAIIGGVLILGGAAIAQIIGSVVDSFRADAPADNSWSSSCDDTLCL